ncbi:MAG: hypothetical protein IJ681_07335 [Bacteroidales bacterium]|nr:hypothetical protein [Bacteroidales bacterium]
MRLRDYQNLLNLCIPKLEGISIQIIDNKARGIANDTVVQGLIAFNEAIDELIDAKIFEKLTSKIRNLKFFNRVSNTVTVQENEYRTLNDLKNKLVNEMQNLKQIIDNILPKEDEYSISIKLPEYETFEEYNNLFKSFKIVFATFDQLQYITELKTFETGSKWIDIKFGKPNKEDIKSILLAISILFNMANFSLDLRNKYLEGEKSIAYLKQYETQVNEDERKKLLEVYEILQKEDNAKYVQYKEQIIEKLLKESGIELNDTEKNDIIPKVGASIEKLGELIDEGMEIRPALNAPEDVKQISEQFNISLEEHKKILIGINSQKLIEQKDKTEDNTNKIEENQEENIDEQK